MAYRKLPIRNGKNARRLNKTAKEIWLFVLDKL